MATFQFSAKVEYSQIFKKFTVGVQIANVDTMEEGKALAEMLGMAFKSHIESKGGVVARVDRELKPVILRP